MSAPRSTSAVFGINRQTTTLLAAILVIGSGEEMWMRFLPKYMEALGASAFLIAAFDAIKTLLGALYAYPGGLVTDRFGQGQRRAPASECLRFRRRMLVNPRFVEWASESVLLI